MAYNMTDLVISDLKCYRENIDEKLKAWYNLATTIAQSVDVQTSVPQLAEGWNRFRSNVENGGPKSYHKRAVAVPFPDDMNSQLQDRLQDRNHLDVFALLPSIMSSSSYNIDEVRELLFQGYKNEMVSEGVHFSSEVRRWFNLWNNKSY